MENKIRVLLAEDDPNLGSLLKSYLEAKGFPTALCLNGHEAFESFKTQTYDFCIVDVMMPVKDGFTLVKDIRKLDRKIPVLFLTAKNLQEDKLKGFEIGADDYVTKPFSMEELLVRMQAILRRTNDSGKPDVKENIYTIGRYYFDSVRQLLTLGDHTQKLTSREVDLLLILCKNKNNVVDRSFALTKIWKDDSYFNARSMDVYITKLRKFLREDPNVELINVHGIGFKLIVNE